MGGWGVTRSVQVQIVLESVQVWGDVGTRLRRDQLRQKRYCLNRIEICVFIDILNADFLADTHITVEEICRSGGNGPDDSIGEGMGLRSGFHSDRALNEAEPGTSVGISRFVSAQFNFRTDIAVAVTFELAVGFPYQFFKFGRFNITLSIFRQKVADRRILLLELGFETRDALLGFCELGLK